MFRRGGREAEEWKSGGCVMKILCDVCGKKEALVFCCADEAALCDACDRRVHCANKLSGKHRRFSLDYPSGHSNPLCDVCQEKRAILFCQEDRAILCSECDAAIHSANRLTMKHGRFLLTGARLSAAPLSAPETEAAAAANSTDGAIWKSKQGKALVPDPPPPWSQPTLSKLLLFPQLPRLLAPPPAAAAPVASRSTSPRRAQAGTSRTCWLKTRPPPPPWMVSLRSATTCSKIQSFSDLTTIYHSNLTSVTISSR
ncbi:unnamed protein product [Musa textilis]